jgi:hypothetical protein
MQINLVSNDFAIAKSGDFLVKYITRKRETGHSYSYCGGCNKLIMSVM